MHATPSEKTVEISQWQFRCTQCMAEPNRWAWQSGDGVTLCWDCVAWLPAGNHQVILNSRHWLFALGDEMETWDMNSPFLIRSYLDEENFNERFRREQELG